MIRTLQSLRFVFVMLVVISHYNDAHFDFGGDCGVSFFFILSGFVLSLAYSDKISEGNFCSWSLLKRQWEKVYPILTFFFLTASSVCVPDCHGFIQGIAYYGEIKK